MPLQLLDCFGPNQVTLSLSDLARETGMPLSTAHRLIGELADWGALERQPDGHYHVGLRLWELGTLAPRGQGLRERALPFLEDLSQITRENVQLVVRHGSVSPHALTPLVRTAARAISRAISSRG